MGREVEFPLSEELEKNLNNLLIAVNKLRDLYGEPLFVSSAYRPSHYNVAAGGSKNSAHLICSAVDFWDIDRRLTKFITIPILEQCGLWMEDSIHTPTWCHVQTRPAKNRIFIP